MKKRITALLLCLISVFVFTNCSVKDLNGLYRLKLLADAPKTQSEATPLFWKATKADGGTVYLFGSIHAADSSYWRLGDDIMQAFLDSDALAVELDLDNLENDFAVQYKMLQLSAYSDNTNLDDHIGKPLADSLINYLRGYPGYLADYGLPLSQIEMLRGYTPAFLSGLVSSFVTDESGLKADWGVDGIFTKLAKELKKEIIELETIELQMDLLYNVSDELGKILIKNAISAPVEFQAAYLKMTYKEWKNGNLAFFEDMVEGEVDWTESGLTQSEIETYLAYDKAMVYDRNIGMAEKAKQFIDEGKTVFYIVGEAHMVGQNGIVSLLRQQGYSAELLSGTADLNSGGAIAA